ncbi:GTP 3',8-cyclase MoaA [Streptomyces cavernae]|uniref:GTP 3',8-cyclase MoaA n=1 Tax=Streptomyces cavernae TaxID=2259034 RepID=UPI000FEC1A5B|nr:GTP 3',8-cyclase MoaA [Streptomyces cavernae]
MSQIPDFADVSRPPGGPLRAPAALPGSALVDRFGRIATNLRISLTDRCNLRCSYCMPAEGTPWCPAGELLTDDEIIRLITVAVRDLGVRQVRFTGGEPLLRRGLERIVAATTSLRTPDGDTPETALTTNGVLLERRATALREAGLRRVNVSLDTLDRARYTRLTRRDRLPEVLAGLRAAAEAGLTPVKINSVLLRGVNEDEAVSLVRWALERGYQPRFIEQMPLGPADVWDRDEMVSAAEILSLLRSELTLTPVHAAVRGAAPAETWIVSDVRSPAGIVPAVGIVASVSRPFCRGCDRTRLTADGQLRTCLFARAETDLRALLRGGASDREIAGVWRGTMWAKQRGHGIDDGEFRRPDRPMSAIGG